MTKPDLTAEQKSQLETHIAGIGHNQGPKLVDHAEEILKGAAGHHRLKDELTGIRVMFDMLRSQLSGEYAMPPMVVGYVIACLGFIAALTGVSTVALAGPTALVDVTVVGFIILTLRGEMEQYVDWRAARDPAYKSIKRELFGGPKAT